MQLRASAFVPRARRPVPQADLAGCPAASPCGWPGVAAAGVVAALLVACGTPPPRTVVAGLATPEQWATSANHSTPNPTAWWTSLGSTGLVCAVAEAVAQNHDLKVALARFDAAAAQARIAGAELYPQIGAGFDAARRQQVFVGLPIPGRGDSPLRSLSTGYQAAFNASWEVDLWGRIRAGQRASIAETEAAAADYRAALESIAARAAKAWLAAVEAGRQLALAEATADTFSSTAWQVRERYRLGLRSALDLRLALNNEASARALVSLRRREMQAALRQLELLAGRYPAGRWPVDTVLPGLPGEIPAGLPSDLLQRRPDLVSAERRLASALQRTREAEAALLPRISLTASGGRSSSQLDDLLSSQFSLWSVAANATQPLFQGGRLLANVDLTEARAREAAEHYRQVVLQAFGEVEDALEAESHLRQRQEDLELSVVQSQEATRLAGERYRLGLTDFVTLVEAQRSAFSAESQLIGVRRQLLDNRVNLHLALGGGFDTPADDTLAATP